MVCWQIYFFLFFFSPLLKPIRLFLCSTVWLSVLFNVVFSFVFSVHIGCYCYCFCYCCALLCCAVADVVASVNMIYIKSQLIYEKDEEKHLPSCQPAAIGKQHTHIHTNGEYWWEWYSSNVTLLIDWETDCVYWLSMFNVDNNKIMIITDTTSNK